MKIGIGPKQLFRYWVLAFLVVLFVFLFLFNAKAEVPITGGLPCGSICHFIPDNYENFHDTRYDSLKWPNLDPDCQQCHQATSTVTLNPNLAQFHVFKQTTTYSPPNYPNGMGCDSCHHNYKGFKLDKTIIAAAINTKNTDCSACHGSAVVEGHEKFHDTTYIDNPPVDCSSCHEMTSSSTGNPNLWKWHLDRPTTSYPGGMDCQSCHDYNGGKLSKPSIETAISSGNTKCDACHTVHEIDPNIKHRTSFLGNAADCNTCHTPSRTPPKDTADNLQDLHVNKQTTTYPTGMTCDGCHKYSGTKLAKSDIDKAVSDGNTACNACHTSIVSVGHEPMHNTQYDSSKWPNLSPDCRSCHEMVSANTGQPNLWKWHLNRVTTSYPGGMDCQSCHSYIGDKLSGSDINNAINNGNTDCSACHGSGVVGGHEAFHDTTYIDNPPVDCSSCHEMTSSTTGNPNLWKWHLDRPTTSYPGGMDCQSCHDYNGTKLSKSSIETAISSGDKKCSACHESKIHQFDPNTDHRTSFMGDPSNCTTCHTPSRSPVKDTTHNLQDLHIGKATTSFPGGMTCDSCHKYNGSSLNPADIANAIAQGGYSGTSNTKCNACHTKISENGHEAQHQTPFDNTVSYGESLCSKCHITDASKPAPFTLWDVHMGGKSDPGKQTTSYLGGMMCTDGCHNYSGSKLDKATIDNAIANGNKDCKDCHTDLGTHALDQNSTFSSSVHSGKVCNDCHDRASSTIALPAKPDSLLLTLPGTNICVTCHSTETSYNASSGDGGTTTPPPGGSSSIAEVDDARLLEDLSNTSSDSNADKSSSITTKMTNSYLSDYVEIEQNEKIINLKLNSDAASYSKVVMRIYAEKRNKTSYARIYAYNVDGDSVDTGAYIDFTLTNSSGAWKEIDVTSLANRMAGDGFMKVRLIDTNGERYKVSEAEFDLTAIAVPPEPEPTPEPLPSDRGFKGGASDVLASFLKPSRHTNVSCYNCHNPHVEDSSTAQAPAADGAQKGTKGVAVTNGAAGTSPVFTLLASVNNQYELCFLCHSNNSFNIYGSIPAGTKDKAVEFNINNAAYHPVEGTGKNLGIKEAAFVLGTPWNPTSAVEGDYSSASAKVYCIDCHGSDNSSEPKGPHGSNIARILKKSVTPGLSGGQKRSVVVGTQELCFLCHVYDVYVNGLTGSRFPRHQYHVQDKKVPCATCHATHGLSDRVHLIGGTGITNFTHTSSGGSCTPFCHGTKSYSHNYPHVSEPEPPPPPGSGGTVKADEALWMSDLSSYTSSDGGSKTTITSNMQDGNFSTTYDVENSDKDKVIALKVNQDANFYSKVTVRFYVTSVDSSPDNARIYAYQSNGTSLNTSSYVSHSVSSTGWKEVDVTSLASKMNGYGWMKFRLVSADKRHKVSEAEFNLTAK